MWQARSRTLNSCFSRSSIETGEGRRGGSTKTLQFFSPPAITCGSHRSPPPTTRRLAVVVASPSTPVFQVGMSFSLAGECDGRFVGHWLFWWSRDRAGIDLRGNSPLDFRVSRSRVHILPSRQRPSRQ